MAEITQILLTNDLTERSRRAVMRAVQLKRATAAGLTLLHLAEPGLTEEVAESRQAAATATMQSLLSHASEGKPRRVAIKVVPGDPGTDLLATGTHGRGRLQTAFLGNVTQELVAASSCDVALPTGVEPVFSD